MWVIVEVLRGGRTGHRQEFKDKSTITVGRNVHCDLVLDAHSDNLASGVHGEVRRASDGTHWWIDRGSSNGSFMGGKRVQQALLQKKENEHKEALARATRDSQHRRAKKNTNVS